MDKKKYRETIAKLLALSQSPNENEAKLALLKAQELMAKYKISEFEVKDIHERLQEKVIVGETEITFSARTNPWIEKMTSLISENYGCECFFTYYAGHQTQTVNLMGLESDVEICVSALQYAVDFVKNKYPLFRKQYKGMGIQQIRSEYNSYAFGFVEGLRKAYKEQVKNKKYELVISVPEIVQMHYSSLHLSAGPVYTGGYAQRRGSQSWLEGMRDGENFGSVKEIEY